MLVVAAVVVVAVAVAAVRGWGGVAGERVVVGERSCYRRAPGDSVRHC